MEIDGKNYVEDLVEHVAVAEDGSEVILFPRAQLCMLCSKGEIVNSEGEYLACVCVDGHKPLLNGVCNIFDDTSEDSDYNDLPEELDVNDFEEQYDDEVD